MPQPAPAPAPVVAPAPVASLQRDPNAAISRIRDGDVLFKQGRYREALLSYDDAVKLDDQSTNAILKQGLAYAKMNFYKEAVGRWQHVLDIDPNNSYAPKYIAKAKPLIDPSQPAFDPNAAQPVQTATTAGAATPVATVAAPSSAPVSAEDEAAAKDLYRNAVKSMQAQQYEPAIGILNSALAKNPRYTNAYIARAGAYFGMRRYQEAVLDYQRALQLTSTLATPLYGLARSYERLNDKPNACAQYRKYASSTAVDVQPGLRKQAQDQATALCGG